MSTVALANGVEMPLLGLGVFQTASGPETENAVRWALEAGYRHVDTAALYANEQSVGRAIAASGLPREELFVTTKLLPRARDARNALEHSLRLLDLDHVDLYLIHWPTGLAAEQWDALERAYEDGLARAIGVSNWGTGDLARTVGHGRIVPHVNQVQFSPFEFRRALLDECRRLGVVFESYSPLTRGRGLRDKTVAQVAERSRPHAGAGDAALGARARDPGHPEVRAPRADRRERAGVRLPAGARGDRGARRARRDGRQRRGPLSLSQPSARCAAIASTTSRPPIARPRRIAGVIQRPACPAASVSTRCQAAEAAPTPAANAAAEAGPSSVRAAATAANDAIVSGLAAVIARKRA